jgi:hypothetical protein
MEEVRSGDPPIVTQMNLLRDLRVTVARGWGNGSGQGQDEGAGEGGSKGEGEGEGEEKRTIGTPARKKLDYEISSERGGEQWKREGQVFYCSFLEYLHGYHVETAGIARI